MNAFKKIPTPTYCPSGGVFEASTFEQVESVNERGDKFLTIEEKKLSPDVMAKRLVLPSSEQYSLGKILATGQVPKEVNVSGMIPSDDMPDVVGAFIDLQARSGKSSEDKPTEDRPTVDKPTVDKPTVDKPIEDKPIE